MPTFRVAKTSNYTVMSNTHFRDQRLSLKAKGLLSFMLSLPDDWDYTQRGLSATCKDGVDSIAAAIKELEQAGYISRQRIREHGRLKDIEYTIYEEPILCGTELPEKEERASANEKKDPDETKGFYITPTDKREGHSIDEEPKNTVNKGIPTYTGKSRIGEKEAADDDVNSPKRDFPRQVSPVQENPVLAYKVNQINTKKQNTNSSHPITSTERMIRDGEDDEYKAVVHRNINYPALVSSGYTDCDMLDEIVDIIVETLCKCSANDYIRISQTNFPASMVKKKLLKLDQFHIEYVMLCLSENRTAVKRVDQYVLTALWNAPSTMNCSYTMRVHHDLAEKEKAAPDGYREFLARRTS